MVPVALGKESSTNTIYGASNNFGNSVMGKIIKDTEIQRFLDEDQHTIRVETIDLTLALVKMNAQGFECNILDGMSQALAAG